LLLRSADICRCVEIGLKAKDEMTDSDPNEADATGPEPAARSSVNKLTWAQVGLVTEPGLYMFKFGWLTITADDVAVWQKHPTAAFTLYSTSLATAPETEDETDEAATEEFRLGTFELRSDSNYSESEK
jgi:hypothetical protein